MSQDAGKLEAREILDMNRFHPDLGGPDADPDSLLARRQRNMGPAAVLFYRRPIEMVRAEGAWMEAADGRRYLDCYNNVPSVGHCHPRVVEAVRRQVGLLNTNTRYLVEIVDRYLEALKARLPGALSNIALTCTGSEANDLALRIARAATGGTGVVVTETAYHGNTLAVTEISPASYKRGQPPGHVRAVPPPGPEAYGADIAGGFARAVAAAFADLAAAGHAPSAFVADPIFSSDGVFADPPGFLGAAVEAARTAGALFVADEVQPGFARTGETFWGFARHGIAPDIVTMGKPMGNGIPLGGLATRPDLLGRFTEDVGYFNTFGGNPVSAAAGFAVLEAIEADGLPANARSVGAHLKAGLVALAEREPRLSAVRGAGLYLGLDLATDGRPDPALASATIDGLRERGVLIGAAGKYGHTLKVRPPLCITEADADLFLSALGEVLSGRG